MAKLTAKQRHGLSASQFALSGARYPIHDASHARNALARGAQHASPAEQAKIKAAVHAEYPVIKVAGKPVSKYAKGGPVQGHLRMAPPHKGSAPVNMHGMPIRSMSMMTMNQARARS